MLNEVDLDVGINRSVAPNLKSGGIAERGGAFEGRFSAWRVSGETENSEHKNMDDEIAGLTELIGGEAGKTLGRSRSQYGQEVNGGKQSGMTRFLWRATIARISLHVLLTSSIHCHRSVAISYALRKLPLSTTPSRKILSSALTCDRPPRGG